MDDLGPAAHGRAARHSRAPANAIEHCEQQCVAHLRVEEQAARGPEEDLGDAHRADQLLGRAPIRLRRRSDKYRLAAHLAEGRVLAEAPPDLDLALQVAAVDLALDAPGDGPVDGRQRRPPAFGNAAEKMVGPSIRSSSRR